MYLNLEHKFHVIGGGINGIITALYITKHFEGYKVYLHESLSELGGKLLGFDYNDVNLYFDRGTHIFQESGNLFLDELIRNAFSDDELIFYPEGKGDIVGSIQNNKIHSETHYLNLKGFSFHLSEVREHLNSLNEPLEPIDIYKSVSFELKKRFGTNFNTAYSEIFNNLFKSSPDELSSICMQFIGFNRVVIDDFSTWNSKANDPIYRSLIGVPNQLYLPEKFRHKRKSFYPNNKGTLSLVNGLIRLLVKHNIEVITNSKIQKFDIENRNFESVVNGKTKSFKYDKAIITSGVISATKILNPNQNIDLKSPMDVTFFNIELAHPTLSNLFYFYNYDSKENFYRVTNYRAFSNKKNDTRITIEAFKSGKDKYDQLEKILNYLKSLNFIKETAFRNVFIEQIPFGFPVLSLNNLKQIKYLNEKLKIKSSNDLGISGLGTGNFNFFQTQTILNSLEIVDKMV